MKSIIKSKTIIVGVISVIVGILIWIQGQIGAGLSITIEGILMVILRLVTKEGLFVKK